MSSPWCDNQSRVCNFRTNSTKLCKPKHTNTSQLLLLASRVSSAKPATMESGHNAPTREYSLKSYTYNHVLCTLAPMLDGLVVVVEWWRSKERERVLTFFATKDEKSGLFLPVCHCVTPNMCMHARVLGLLPRNNFVGIFSLTQSKPLGQTRTHTNTNAHDSCCTPKHIPSTLGSSHNIVGGTCVVVVCYLFSL